MATPVIVKYPLDLTGVKPENRVHNEEHVIPRERSRGFAPNYGAFFTKSLVVRHKETGYTLIPTIDYIALHLYEKAAKASGQEVCAGILIVNDKLQGTFQVDYQVIGGEFSVNSDAIEELIAALELDNRPVHWGDLLGKPEEFPPSPHLHDIDDLYGFEFVIEALERIRAAILLGDYYDHEQLRQLIINLKNYVDEHFAQTNDILNQHLSNFNNPHKTTKAQVGLGLVQNYSMANQAEAEAGALSDRYMSPKTTMQAMIKYVASQLDPHLQDYNNPHQTTKAQVGLSNVDNYATASQAEAEAGVASDKFMTALRVKQAITFQAGNLLNAHINNVNNPHNTTKAQVGLSEVDNFATATQSEAEAGTVANKFMTPLRTKQAIAKLAGDLLNAHIADKANPHNTTKAQVGLGSVENYPMASAAEAVAGTATDRYMSPARTWDLLWNRLQSYVPRSDVAYGGGGWNQIVNKIPFIQSNGVMEFGQYQDWHDAGNDGDYKLREELRFNVAVGWEIYNTGHYNVQDIFIRSDIRDKSRIEAIGDPMSIVRMLQGYRYALHNADQLTAGLIAQEIQKVFPEAVLVSENEDGEERLVVRSGAINGLLVACIRVMDEQQQAQQAQLERHEAILRKHFPTDISVE